MKAVGIPHRLSYLGEKVSRCMRLRTIKPGFFANEELAECKPLSRILFIGLWCIADREGWFELRPKRIKMELLPYDNIDVEVLLGELESHGFIRAYKKDDSIYVKILNFTKHQYPNVKEKESTIQALCFHGDSTEQAHHLTDIQIYSITDKQIKGGMGGNEEKVNEQQKKKKGVYGQFNNVKLFAGEFESLVIRFNEKGAKERIDNLSEYLASKGKHYASHYATILSWERKHEKEGKKEGPVQGSNGATKAWLDVMQSIRSNTPIEDERAKKALESIGGRGIFYNAQTRDLQYIQKNFEKNYNAS